jgi:hypothetical protein
MDERRTVVLYGDTVLLAGIGRTLSTRSKLRVLSLDPTQPTAGGALDSLRPCAVVVDLTVVTVEAALALVERRPGLLLIGLDPGSGRVMVLAGEDGSGLRTEDLVWLIQNGAHWRQRRVGGSRRTTSRSCPASLIS